MTSFVTTGTFAGRGAGPVVLAALTGWLGRGRARRAHRRALAEVPDSLRKDIGLDGGMALARFENGGRTFVVGRCPDPTLSGWHW